MFDASSEEFEKLVETIDWVTSFTAARYVGVNFYSGYFENEALWECFQRPYRDNWSKQNNWFHPFSDIFLKLLNVAYIKIIDDHWSNILKILLSWYIESYEKSLLFEK
ncbi:hypothetical protein HMSSN036_79340 [Paenibacillus macerans]|nr:hypothetical protein HMSSN036_79340 [Paenibacillus macerans]